MLNLVRFWILLSALLSGAGWILSALHLLNRTGYALVFLLGAALLLPKARKMCPPSGESLARSRHKWGRRFRRPLPQLFLLTAALAFLGGCLYPAMNCDANAYRLPRMMHWLWAGQWHWIHTFDSRMNIAACGMEWLSCPLILFTHGDRLLFLINWISYLMLPGLIFGMFTQLQVSPRVAWWWAWPLSSGWCFVLQAGSAANDSFAAVYILAAVTLALRARASRSFTDAGLSLLAAALVTGVKQTDIPLFALWLIAIWPARSLFWRRPLATAAVATLGALVSALPISILNQLHYGTWMPVNVTGVATIGNFHLSPFWGIVGNLFCIPVQNLVPPFYNLWPPFYSSWPLFWNEEMQHFLRTPLGAHFASFESFGRLSVASFHGFTEASVGLGFGLCVLIGSTLYESHRLARVKVASRGPAPDPVRRRLRLAAWGVALVFMAKVGTIESARHLAPYYAFLFPLWLVRPGPAQVVRLPTWQRLAGQIMVLAILLLATLSARPLFPAATLFEALRAKFPRSDFLTEAYAQYRESNFPVAIARRHYLAETLPPDEQVVGFFPQPLSEDEPGLWLPYGRRRVEIILPDDPPARARALGLRYIVVDDAAVPARHGGIQKWLETYDATIVGEHVFPMSPQLEMNAPKLYLVRLNEPADLPR